jgi:hypothetical protein
MDKKHEQAFCNTDDPIDDFIEERDTAISRRRGAAPSAGFKCDLFGKLVGAAIGKSSPYLAAALGKCVVFFDAIYKSSGDGDKTSGYGYAGVCTACVIKKAAADESAEAAGICRHIRCSVETSPQAVDLVKSTKQDGWTAGNATCDGCSFWSGRAGCRASGCHISIITYMGVFV